MDWMDGLYVGLSVLALNLALDARGGD